LLTGGPGHDSYRFDTDSAQGSDTVNESGGGSDRLDFGLTSTLNVAVNLSNAAAQVVNANLTLTLSAGNTIENFTGGAQSDTITGNALNNSLSGGTGADLYAFDTDSPLGSDTVGDTGGTDSLYFGATTTLGVTVNLGTTAAQVVNANLTLTLSAGNSIEIVTGGGLADTLIGNALNNTLNGGGGNDVVVGGAGADTLQGGAGLDLLIGGASGDTLTGGAGDDILIGGTTSHDASVAALNALMAEWSSAAPYLTRIAHLTNAQGGGNNGTFFLKPAGGTPAGATVFDDSSADSLLGATEQDWFFASAGDTKDDVGGETVTTI
jgi:Ca2+-binding RTX toxin-like protein